MAENPLKIGIVTYHRAYNYGAVLQAYALCRYLNNLGLNAEIVDYWPKHHSYVYRTNICDSKVAKKLPLLKRFKYYLITLICSKKNIKRYSNFEKFIREQLPISSSFMNTVYDAVFYGSDTIWNTWKMNSLHKGFDDVMWGSNTVQAKHKFSYAPSMGNVIDSIETKMYCERMLPNFDKISVRETNLLFKLNEWGFKDVVKVVDPTILLTKEQWDSITPSRIVKEEYVLCYNLESSSIIDYLALCISKKYNLRIIYMTAMSKPSFNKNVYDTAGVYEFLSLIKNAQFVVTSSFHGVVFSIINHKQFCFHSDCETERISSILSSCGLSDRFVDKPDVDKLESVIDYASVDAKLALMRRDSYRFIEDCLKISRL